MILHQSPQGLLSGSERVVPSGFQVQNLDWVFTI